MNPIKRIEWNKNDLKCNIPLALVCFKTWGCPLCGCTRGCFESPSDCPATAFPLHFLHKSTRLIGLLPLIPLEGFPWYSRTLDSAKASRISILPSVLSLDGQITVRACYNIAGLSVLHFIYIYLFLSLTVCVCS